MNVKQKIITRESQVVDFGTMGFHDYETIFEGFGDFVNRVSDAMNELNTIFVSYPDCNTAIIQYWSE